jgi:hypothetical protein
MEGTWDKEEIGAKLLELEYQQDSYMGMPYYRLHEDFSYPPQHPLRHRVLPINRIAFMNDWLLAAPATEILEDMIDLQTGEAASLHDSQRHQALAAALGDEVLAGALVTPQWVTEEWQGHNIVAIQRVDPYIEGPDKWDNLSDYSAAFIGLNEHEGADEIVMAFYYPDRETAAKDAPVLEERWQSFRFIQNVGREGGSVLETPTLTPALWDPAPDMTPVTDACAPLSTSVTQLADASVLVATCPVIRNQDDPFLARGANLWYWLYSNRWLEILAPNIQELKRIAESK